MTCATILGMATARTLRRAKPRPRADEPHLIQETVRTYQVLIAGISRAIGMSASRFALMRLLAELDVDADVGVMDLARQVGINAAAVTRQVQELEREQLLRRRADPQDGRRSYVRLSPKGRRLLDRILAFSHEFEHSLSAVLSADEMTSAARTLRKLRAFVEGWPPPRKGADR
jgi:DNA-binding MarR family transcriptional regulator